MRRPVKTKKNTIFALLLALLLCSLTACGGSSGTSAAPSGSASKADPAQHRVTRTTVLVPEAPGEEVYEGENVIIDASRTSDGYLVLRYSGSADKAKVQITAPDEAIYTYTLTDRDRSVFPLSGGDGDYHVDVLEHVNNDLYSLLYSAELTVGLENEFGPFLYPNQYVWFTADSGAVSLSEQLSDQSADDLDYVAQVYHYVIGNIVYDTEKAENVSSGYLPDVDDTLESGKGICFDYASLMAAMLRCQDIPTKLVVGYSGPAYHAWISVYVEGVGWVDNVIQFDGEHWSLMDPTLAASNDASAVKKYVGDGSNYTVKYCY